MTPWELHSTDHVVLNVLETSFYIIIYSVVVFYFVRINKK